HDLAAGPALLGRQLLALQRQAAPLLGAQLNPGFARRRRKGLLENQNLLPQVVDPPCHPLVDRVRDHRDDELERHREHQVAPRLPAICRIFKPAVCPRIVQQSAAMGFWTVRDPSGSWEHRRNYHRRYAAQNSRTTERSRSNSSGFCSTRVTPAGARDGTDECTTTGTPASSGRARIFSKKTHPFMPGIRR